MKGIARQRDTDEDEFTETVGYPAVVVSLTGTYIPGDGRGPCFLRMRGSPHLYMALFSSKELLDETMTKAGVGYTQIKEVVDGEHFLDGLPKTWKDAEFKVILDPIFVTPSQVRYIELDRG